jgi:hypothetical protein
MPFRNEMILFLKQTIHDYQKARLSCDDPDAQKSGTTYSSRQGTLFDFYETVHEEKRIF